MIANCILTTGFGILKPSFTLKRLGFLYLLNIAVLCTTVNAEEIPSTPSAQVIIDALSQPKTRSFRNLGVRPSNNPEQTTVDAQGSESENASIDLAIQFEFNSAIVSRDSRKVLEALTEALMSPKLEQARFQIEGHTDSKGSASYNQKLSQARANEVKRFLISRRIAEKRLVTLGKGSSEPLNRTDTTAPENRRVRILKLEH